MSPRTEITRYKPPVSNDPWGLTRSSHWAEPQENVIEARKMRSAFQQWFKAPNVPKLRGIRDEQWIEERLRFAVSVLRESVTVDPDIRGGVPVLKGTRIPVSQILAEIADDASVSEIAQDLDLDAELLVKLLEGMAIHLDRPFLR